jgi:hypothetical protein
MSVHDLNSFVPLVKLRKPGDVTVPMWQYADVTNPTPAPETNEYAVRSPFVYTRAEIHSIISSPLLLLLTLVRHEAAVNL